MDIKENTFGNGLGICVGGVVYEYCDEWWHIGKYNKQDKILDKGIYYDFCGIIFIKIIKLKKRIYFLYKKI